MCHSFCPRTTAHQLVQCKILVVHQSWTQIYSPPLLILRQVGISSLLWEVFLGVGVPWHLFQQLSNKMEQKTVQLPCLLVTLLHFSCSYIIENGIPVPNPFCNTFSDICNQNSQSSLNGHTILGKLLSGTQVLVQVSHITSDTTSIERTSALTQKCGPGHLPSEFHVQVCQWSLQALRHDTNRHKKFWSKGLRNPSTTMNKHEGWSTPAS